jgi:hypothetical protein
MATQISSFPFLPDVRSLPGLSHRRLIHSGWLARSEAGERWCSKIVVQARCDARVRLCDGGVGTRLEVSHVILIHIGKFTRELGQMDAVRQG